MEKKPLQREITQDEAEKGIALHSAWLDHKKWEKEGNAIAGLRSVSKFAKLGYSPPQDLMSWVVSNFEKYLESDNSLDKTFNVSQGAKRKERTDKRNADFVVEIKVLTHSFKITVDDAKYCLNRRLEEAGSDKADSSITDIYDRAGSKVSDKKMLDEILTESNVLNCHSEEAINRLLEMYPQDVREFLSNRIEK